MSIEVLFRETGSSNVIHSCTLPCPPRKDDRIVLMRYGNRRFIVENVTWKLAPKVTHDNLMSRKMHVVCYICEG